MARLSSELIAKIEARIALKEEQLALANAALTELLEGKPIESYELNTTGGDQRVKRRKINEYLVAIDNLEGEIDVLYRRLNGSQIVSQRLRRKC
jgi:hypothetical protein